MNACVFCGRTGVKMTREHVFGDWISKYFIEELGIDLNGSAEIVNADGSATYYPITPFQQTVNIVCKQCNEGWMSELEVSVMNRLKLMITGKSVMLRSNAQRNLAFWCAKTALVLDHLHPQSRIIPDLHFNEMFESRSALKSQVVLVAYRSVTTERPGQLLASALKQPVLNIQVDSASFSTTAEQIQSYAATGHRMYKVTFAVGNFAALVFGHDFPMPMSLNSPRPISKHIWPLNQRFQWSNELSVDRIGGLPAFHAAFAPSDKGDLPEDVPGRIKPSE